MKRSLYLDKNLSLKGFLRDALSGDVLIVGIDPVWDQDILRIIPTMAKGSVWLVSEEEDIIDISSDLANLLHERSSFCVLGSEGSYDSFLSKLHDYLRGTSFSNYRHKIAKTVDSQPNMEKKLTNLRTALDTMQERIARLTTVLDGIHDQLQPQQEENQILFHNAFHELHEIQRKLKEVEKEQLRDN